MLAEVLLEPDGPQAGILRREPLHDRPGAVTGAVVALCLFLQIVLSLLYMYRLAGKLVVLLLLVVGAGGVLFVYSDVVKPHLEKQKAAMTAQP